jgi:hypothetical protein
MFKLKTCPYNVLIIAAIILLVPSFFTLNETLDIHLHEASNKYYKRYKRLDVKATNEELITLTNDSSKVIVLAIILHNLMFVHIGFIRFPGG